MTHLKKIVLGPFFAICISQPTVAAPKAGAFLNAKDAGAAFQIQGEYAVKLAGVQVIALGDGKYRAVIHKGGLPGAGWDKGKKIELDGAATTSGANFPEANGWAAQITGGTLRLTAPNADALKLEAIQRKSPTLGSRPPKGATILFDGTDAKQFKPGKITKDGLLEQGANSVQRFQSHRLHIEFRLPFQPKARGQGRGNSGCYLQGRYEVQMLDSFGLAGKHNECGGIYTIKAPDVNMCFPPLSWQTYDIDFTAAQFKDGKKVADAVITVFHNGVKIHDQVKLPKRTTASPLAEGPDPGFIHLQNHGNPVRYRNIWVLEK
ncbi:MAG: DUF1080 domain-containing protein [Verrucomicrobia subdivision 3 bacterium]|nr:DUF1080 domain-containing protein [Limisphaerales bacterium]